MTEQDISLEDTVLDTWFERDRAYIGLYLKSDEARSDALLELWDDAVSQAFEDGFLEQDRPGSDSRLHASAFEYAKELGRFDPENRIKRDPAQVGVAIIHEDLGVFMGWNKGPVYLWSSQVDAEHLKKGAYTFTNEQDAVEFMTPNDDDDPAAAYEGKLSYQEVVLDIQVPASSLRRASVEQLGLENSMSAGHPSI